MGYIEHNLIEGESVLYHARLHWIVMAKHLLIAAVLVVLAIVALQFNRDTLGAGADYAPTAAAILIVFALISVAVGFLVRAAREYAVTNKRVVMQIGVVQRRTEEMFLNKIESISVDQTVTGRMMGYGSVVIRGTGGSFEPFPRVAAPLELRRRIQEQIGKSFELPDARGSTK